MVVFIVVGVALIAVGVYYWVTPAESLASFVPGHLAGSTHHHLKHGLLALILGVLSLLGAWMVSGRRAEQQRPVT
jgi:hypothetical protein